MQLTAAGNAELNARAAAVFTVDAEGLVKSQLVLDTDYALGDLVNVVEYGQTFSVQITEVDEDWANNSYDLVMALGKQALTTESVLSDTASSLGQTNTSKGSLGWKTPTISYDLSSGNRAQGYGDIVNDVINIIGTINANRTLTLLQPDSASVGRKKYTVIITPQASSGGPFTVTLTTGVSGKQNVVIPIIKSADTLLSGILQFDIFVDSAGNVSSNSFLVRGSNSYGEYVKRSDKTMTCRFTSGTLSTATGGPSGGIYYTTPTVILAFPEAFSAIPWVIPTVKRGTTALTWGEVENGTTNTTVPMVVLSTSNVGSSYLSYIAEGQWIA
jgi:hypothetical protein